MTRQVPGVGIVAVVAAAFMIVFLGGNTAVMMVSRTLVQGFGGRRGRAKQMRH